MSKHIKNNKAKITKDIKELIEKKELVIYGDGQHIGVSSEEGTLYLIEALKGNNPILESIDICNQPMKDEVIINFVEALKENRKVERVSLSRLKVSKKGMMNLIEGFKTNTTVKILYLYIPDNILEDDGAIVFAEVLKCNSRLEELHIPANDICSKGGVALAEALKKNNSLEYLYLEDNDIEDEGAIAMAEALRINKRLKWLNLAFNKISNKGAIALMDVFEESKSLLWVDVESGDVDDKILDKIYAISETKPGTKEVKNNGNLTNEITKIPSSK